MKTAVIFHSSIGKHVDTSYLARHLKCTFTKESAFFIKRNEAADNPDENLEEKVDKCVTNETDLIIIQVGSNEITNLDIQSRPLVTLHEVVTNNMKHLLDLAEYTANSHSCKVFISALPPRYDSTNHDPAGTRSMLTDLANAVLTSNSMTLENVHLIEHSDLKCSGKSRKDTFTGDGVHLTKRGTHILTTDFKNAPDIPGPD